jgi:hypothetical protein
LQFLRAAPGRVALRALQLRAAFGGIQVCAVQFERAALGRVGPDALAALLGTNNCIRA